MAQVTYDGNGAVTGADGNTFTNFTVPAGNDRVLIVGQHFRTATGVTYNGMAMTSAVGAITTGTNEIRIWYLPLGSGGAIGPADIVFSGVVGGGGLIFRITAANFQGVDQATVFANPMTYQVTSNSSSIMINSLNTNNLIVDATIHSTVTTSTPAHLSIVDATAGGLARALVERLIWIGLLALHPSLPMWLLSC